MIIGTDVSLKECKTEGYMMMEYDGRKPFTLDTIVTIFRYYPKYIRKEMGIKGLGRKQWTCTHARDLWFDYQRHKKDIQSFADYHIEDINEIKDYYDLLNLCDIVDAYLGLVE
jgi:hypothetical protein